MKWIILVLWVASKLFFYFRGKLKPSSSKPFIDHSVLINPLNAILVLTPKIGNAPFIATSSFKDLKIIQENFQVFKKEASLLFKNKETLSSKKVIFFLTVLFFFSVV